MGYVHQHFKILFVTNEHFLPFEWKFIHLFDGMSRKTSPPPPPPPHMVNDKISFLEFSEINWELSVWNVINYTKLLTLDWMLHVVCNSSMLCVQQEKLRWWCNNTSSTRLFPAFFSVLPIITADFWLWGYQNKPCNITSSSTTNQKRSCCYDHCNIDVMSDIRKYPQNTEFNTKQWNAVKISPMFYILYLHPDFYLSFYWNQTQL